MNINYTLNADLILLVSCLILVSVACSSSDKILTTPLMDCDLAEFYTSEACANTFNDENKIYALGEGTGTKIIFAFGIAQSKATTMLAKKVAEFQGKLEKITETVIRENQDGSTTEIRSTIIEFEDIKVGVINTEVNQCGKLDIEMSNETDGCYVLQSTAKDEVLADANRILKREGVYELVSKRDEYQQLVASL